MYIIAINCNFPEKSKVSAEEGEGRHHQISRRGRHWAGSQQVPRGEVLETVYGRLRMAPEKTSTSQSLKLVNVIFHGKVFEDGNSIPGYQQALQEITSITL